MPFDARHHPLDVVDVVGTERRDREAAVAADHGRHAVQRRRRQTGIPQHLGVVVRVHVDEARRDHEPGGVDRARRRLRSSSRRRRRSVPSRTPTSARTAGAPVPSTTDPPRTMRSSISGRRPRQGTGRPRRSTTVPAKNDGFAPVKKRTGLANTKSRKSVSSIQPWSTISHASSSTSLMSGTSQCATSEPNMALKPRAERVDLGVERGAVHRVVGLAPEEEAGHEQFGDVGPLFDAARGELVEQRRIFGRTGDAHRFRAGGERSAVLRHEVEEQRLVDGRPDRGARARCGCASPSARSRSREQRRRPRDAAFEEREVERGEAAGHAARGTATCRARAGPRRGGRCGCTCSSRSSAGSPIRSSPSGTRRRRRARRTSATPGRSRRRCRCRTCRSTCSTAPARDRAATAAATGRCTYPASSTALNPSVPTAYSSSAIASSGVCIGIAATGIRRSENSANASALHRFRARHAPRRSASSQRWRNASPTLGYTTLTSMPSSSRRSYSRPGNIAVARSRVLRAGEPHHGGRAARRPHPFVGAERRASRHRVRSTAGAVGAGSGSRDRRPLRAGTARGRGRTRCSARRCRRPGGRDARESSGRIPSWSRSLRCRRRRAFPPRGR